MALIFLGQSCCAICGDVITPVDEIVATSHFIADPTDHLWRFSDAPMHRPCFLAWELRAEFVARFNTTARGLVFANGTYHEMQPEGAILVRTHEDVT
ncbi:MAG: hypothetical protein IT428_19310 [Planctomycetaceae bacterium]|nr:hypothetical protein [Planctomycetaceae bacterium]